MRTTNHKKIVTVLTASFVTCVMHAAIMMHAQDGKKTVAYLYDASGNRIARGIQASRFIQKSPALLNTDNIANITPLLTGCYMIDLNNALVPDECYIYVYDTAGKMLYTKQLGKHKTKIDISRFGNGSYIIKIAVKTGTRTFKITKDR